MSAPLVFDRIEPMRRWVLDAQRRGKTVGLVPTMGALHEGHLSLVRTAHAQTDLCVVTIFVNPTQFAAHEDLSRYPRPTERDLAMLAGEGVAAVFHPSPNEMYPPGFGTMIEPPPVGRRWEGEFRPTHFSGVATVVLKLFQIIPADAAFFGQKDYQQLRVIESMARDLNVATRVVGCPIVRDPDGLAMSSRNAYLSADQRAQGLTLSRSLNAVEGLVNGGISDVGVLLECLANHLSSVDRVDYAIVVDAQSLEPVPKVDRTVVALIAAHVGGTRLIDNRTLTPPEMNP